MPGQKPEVEKPRQTIRRGSGGHEAADPIETLRTNWGTAVRITRSLAKAREGK
jgi:hypothetical protein